MSRAYRVQVRESLSRVVRGEDRVSTTLEILEILPCEAMAGLLHDELARRGFTDEDGRMVRRAEGMVIEVDPASGEVSVHAEATETFEGEAAVEGYADTDWGKAGKSKAEQQLRDTARQRLEAQAEAKAGEVRGRATARLEAELDGLKSELDQVVNRVTAEALKRKAASIGQIKAMDEDAEAGSLTIVLEV